MARLFLHPSAAASHCFHHHHHYTNGNDNNSYNTPRLGSSWRGKETLDLPPLSSTHLVKSPLRRRRPSLSSLSFSIPLSTPYAAASPSSDSSLLVSSVGSPVLLQWKLDRRHIVVLNAVACLTAISASWLFFSAIPTLLAFQRAAESLEKLMDVTREELPDTMAAVRLSGMEISDLTMELSDLGQEITNGIRSSTRAVRLAEDRLRRLTTMAPKASVQVLQESRKENKAEGPALATTARKLREGIVKGRVALGLVSSLACFSRLAWNFFAARGQRRLL